MVDISVTREQDHPIHIHGYKFYVVAMDIVGLNVTLDIVREMNEQGKIQKKLVNATAKDTISVPNAGYAIIRFITDNPGFWLFHCHVSNHMELGMSLVFQVGNYGDMAAPPPNFPKCGSSFYNVEEEILKQNSSGHINKQIFNLVFLLFSMIICLF
uniref:Plastocyanin-like domain-containing protein n=2 Tax=Clastoptera arizonana TaxID=38151 RepID=A0A1B6D0K9_9HEMI